MSIRTATTRPLPHLLSRRAPIPPCPHRRPFFTLPGGGSNTQTLTASRTLPYGRDDLYRLVADVDSYAQFVPYCARSRVTQWSVPDDSGRSWPVRADLHVGWGGLNEEFTSRLRCVPGVSVEAVSGNPEGATSAASSSSSSSSLEEQSDASAVFKSLVTRWSLRPIAEQPAPATEVHLSIKYQFTNPLYAAVSAAVSDKVAALMIEAFEKRAKEQLGRRGRV
ncbi:cyclase/dehydrase family protein [Cordyceps fumosorosea ARSEF 2679]|uniref:Cyclase/dehydrase family protein n=1 Tax=Cordyceps fumosorosea (strain ARSEF 2679) TaxID=1081104 RepID=A0A167YF28_CORFA|nr:cyclase/dehydrase family protein [Cordyceps fumosorosea ARSEF 2679]OAA66251.1 cyclase/dehydrase family protein [Cordyceps fumosorosea ARSEF 2679]